MTSTTRIRLMRDFEAHAGEVRCLSIGRKSGLVFATGGEDRKVNLWSLTKQNAIMSLSGHTSGVSCVTFDSNEEVVCAGSSGGTLKLWDLENQRVVRSLNGHKSACTSVDFHPHGEYFASGGQDTSVRLWDVRRKLCIHTYSGHTGAVTCSRFTPDGRWLVTGGEDGQVLVWDLTQGKLLHKFEQHSSNPITSLDFHPNEFLLATGSADRVVRFFDLESLEEVSCTTPELTKVRSVSFSPDGRFLFSAFQDSLRILTWEPAEARDSIAVNWPGLLDTAFVKDQFVGCASHSNRVYIWVVALNKLRPYCNELPATLASPLRMSPPSSSSSIQQANSHQQPQQKQQMDGEGSATSEALKMLNFTHRPQSRAKRLIDEDEAIPPSSPANASQSNQTNVESSSSGVTPAPDVIDQPKIAPISWTRSPARPLTSISPPQTSSSSATITTANEKQSQQQQQQQPLIPPMSGGVIHVHSTLEPLKQVSPPPSSLHSISKQSQLQQPPNSQQTPPPQQQQQQTTTTTTQLQPLQTPISRQLEMNIAAFNPSGISTNAAILQSQQQRSAEFTAEEQIIAEFDSSHETMVSLLNSRLKRVKVVKSLWSTSSIREAIDALLGMNDLQLTADVISVMLRKPDLFTLERAAMLVPAVLAMIECQYEETIVVGLSTISLFLTSFGELIKSTLEAPALNNAAPYEPSREDRIERCRILVTAFARLKTKLTSLSRRGGRLGPQSRQLSAMLKDLNLPGC